MRKYRLGLSYDIFRYFQLAYRLWFEQKKKKKNLVKELIEWDNILYMVSAQYLVKELMEWDNILYIYM